MAKYIEKLLIALLVLLNVLFSADYLIHGTKPANFDAVAHITTIAQFHKAMQDGEFPVMWGDGFANYGLPIGTIAHQIPAYAGAALTLVTQDVLLSFHIVYMLGAIASALALYVLMRQFVSAESAFVASVFYTLAPYRIINFYLRGAYPEFLSAVWVPLILLALYKAGRKISWWHVLFVASSAALILTHPMLLIIYAPLFLVWLLLFTGKKFRTLLYFGAGGLLALGISAYYFLPLNIESKYLYHGITKSHYAPNQTTDVASFINPFWRYNCTYRNDIFGRCHLIKAGMTESVIFAAALFLTALFVLKVRRPLFVQKVFKWAQASNIPLMRLWLFAVIGGLVAIAFSSTLFEPMYMRVRLLGNIQYPWRFLSAYLFMPPILIGIMSEYAKRYSIGQFGIVLSIVAIVFLRFPQLYAKNYTHLPQSSYYFTPINLHSFMMNTIWSGESADYPVRRDKAHIESGKGIIRERKLKNSWREYKMEAETELLISEATFYFPGWNVYIDGQKTGIEFQDPNYRGVITYKVPPGTHTVRVVYEDTKTRLAGKTISAFSIAVLGVGMVTLAIRDKRRKSHIQPTHNA